jgi:tRNA(fMet)-specific endonuclease VapC
MTAPLVIDTDIASYVIKGRHPVVDVRFTAADPARLCISAVTQAELLYGLKALDPAHRLHLAVHRFLREIAIMPWDSDAATAHADIRHLLVSGGNAIGEMDMMIAAHAIALGAVLVTNNVRHYGRLSPMLAIENWVDDRTP